MRTSTSGGIAGASGGSKQVHYDKGNTSTVTVLSLISVSLFKLCNRTTRLGK